MAYIFGTCSAPNLITGIVDSYTKERRGSVVDLEDCGGNIVETKIHGIKEIERETVIIENEPAFTQVGTNGVVSVSVRYSRGSYAVAEIEKHTPISS